MSVKESPSVREFRNETKLLSFLGKSKVVPIRINVVGPAKDPRIDVVPSSPKVKRNPDHVVWVPGANCGEWTVTFDKGAASPLKKEGPYSSKGHRGGDVVGKDGFYPYSVEAVDLRSGDTVCVDPDLVVVPMS